MGLNKVFLFVTIFVMTVCYTSFLHAFEFNGFSDVTFSQRNQVVDKESGPSQFAIGQIDFYAVQNIDDELDLLLEYVVESAEGEWIVDLERIQIGYFFNDYFKLRAGRFHKTVGYWNPTYHHAAQLHLTAFRPQFLEFEDGDGAIIPTHTIGLWGSGIFEGATGSLSYDLMIGNGSSVSGDPGEAELVPLNTSDNDRNKEVTLNIQYEPYGVIGSGIGLFATTSKVRGVDSGGVEYLKVSQLIVGGDIFLHYNELELLAEVFVFNHSNDLDSMDDTGGTASYVQAGYEFGDITPYARYEVFSKDEVDPYFAAIGAGEYSKKIVGLNYNIHNRSTLKLEADFHDLKDPANPDEFGEYVLQWTFLF